MVALIAGVWVVADMTLEPVTCGGQDGRRMPVDWFLGRHLSLGDLLPLSGFRQRLERLAEIDAFAAYLHAELVRPAFKDASQNRLRSRWDNLLRKILD